MTSDAPAPERVYHLALADEFDSSATEYTASTRGRSLAEEGYVHLSTREQLAGVAERFYSDVFERLLVLQVDPALLPSGALRFEAVGAQTFPHLYAPLPASAIVSVTQWR